MYGLRFLNSLFKKKGFRNPGYDYKLINWQQEHEVDKRAKT